MGGGWFATLLLLALTDVGWCGETISPAAVTYSQRSFIIQGKPTLLFSGSIHYTRIPPADWNDTIKLAQELGLNCIQTYVFWSEHEPVPGKFNWEGYGDLLRFIDLAAVNDMYVVVRVGPYICGEYYFGGIPLWMRHASDNEGNEIECFRCTDPIWKREMQRWVSLVVDKLRFQFASNGGPIIWMQVENEYEFDDDYLEWAVDIARNATIEVPWSLCGHNVSQCNKVNRVDKKRAICTVNGFWMDEGDKGSQPGPEFMQMLWSGNPMQPAVWTEDQGWFDIWGMAKRVRWTSDQLYGMARFFAYGGSYHNFYMLSGGNNYGLRAGRDATTAYAPDTVIDSLLLRHEPRFSIYRTFFRTLKAIEHALLKHEIPLPISLRRTSHNAAVVKNSTAEAHEYGHIAFLSNFGECSADSGYYEYNGHSYFLSNHSVVILNVSSSVVLFNTSTAILSEEENEYESKKQLQTLASRTLGDSSAGKVVTISDWVYYKEEVGYGAITQGPRTSPEQLNITDNESDYMWYTFFTNAVGKLLVNAFGWGGIFYFYVNGVLSNSIEEDKNKWRKQERTRRVDILSVAMGLNTVVHPQLGKGIVNVTVGEGNAAHTTFSTAWKLKGEELSIYTDHGSARVHWQSMESDFLNRTDNLVWLKGGFNMPAELVPSIGGAQPNQTAMVVNLLGMNKGMAFVNGFNIGRYWLLKGECDGQCAPPRHGRHCYLHWEDCGKPTQYLYHIPFEVLKRINNTIVLFEETASSSERNLKHLQLQILHEHPR